MRAEGVSVSDLRIRSKASFRDGKRAVRSEILEERYKMHLELQAENIRIVLERRAEAILKDRRKTEAQKQLREQALHRKRLDKLRKQETTKAQCAPESVGTQRSPQQVQDDNSRVETDLGGDSAVSYVGSIRDLEEQRQRMLEEEDRRFAEKRMGIAKAKIERAAVQRRRQAEAEAEALAEQKSRQEQARLAEEQKKVVRLQQRRAREKERLQQQRDKQDQLQKLLKLNKEVLEAAAGKAQVNKEVREAAAAKAASPPSASASSLTDCDDGVERASRGAVASESRQSLLRGNASVRRMRELEMENLGGYEAVESG